MVWHTPRRLVPDRAAPAAAMARGDTATKAQAHHALEHARLRGDRQSEITSGLVVLSQLAGDLQQTLRSIMDLYDDHLQEALADAAQYFPFPLSMELQQSRASFNEIVDGVEDAYSLIVRLVAQVEGVSGGRSVRPFKPRG
jgi:hypothetical protein